MLSLAMALSLAACGGDSGSSDGDAANDAEGSGDKVVRIGVFEPATGDSGPGGKQEMLGMQYANQETPTVDIGGETYTVELVYADNGSDSSKAITAASEPVSYTHLDVYKRQVSRMASPWSSKAISPETPV